MISSCSGTLATFQDNTIHFDSLLPGCRSYQPPLHVCLLQNQITTSAPISAANNLMTLVILSIATQPPDSNTNRLAPHTITQLFFNYRKGKTKQNDRQFKKEGHEILFPLSSSFPPGCNGWWQMEFNSSKLENGGNKETMKIRNPSSILRGW